MNWYIAGDCGIETPIRYIANPTEDGNGVVCYGATPTDAELIIAVPALLGAMGRLLANEDDYDPDASRCHWCQNDPHTDGCPGEEAKALEAQLGSGLPPPHLVPTVISVHDGLADVVQSAVTVEIIDYDVAPGSDEEFCTCGDHDSQYRPYGHTVTEPTVKTI